MFSEIIGETPVNLLNSTLLAVLPTWGPIYEFSFEFRLNCELVPLCDITDYNKGAPKVFVPGGPRAYWSRYNRISVFNLLREAFKKV